jgi:hypothetical protein
MKMLTFQAKHFGWEPFSKTLPDVVDVQEGDRVEDAIVVFLHLEAKDENTEERSRVFRHTLKHIKWLANKRSFRNVVLHSFTHLGAENADAEFALAFMEEMAERLRSTDYTVWLTPFGYFCEWSLSVYGESLAKVWKSV